MKNETPNADGISMKFKNALSCLGASTAYAMEADPDIIGSVDNPVIKSNLAIASAIQAVALAIMASNPEPIYVSYPESSTLETRREMLRKYAEIGSGGA